MSEEPTHVDDSIDRLTLIASSAAHRSLLCRLGFCGCATSRDLRALDLVPVGELETSLRAIVAAGLARQVKAPAGESGYVPTEHLVAKREQDAIVLRLANSRHEFVELRFPADILPDHVLKPNA